MQPDAGRPPTDDELAFVAGLGPDAGLPAEAIGALLGTWSHWHGLVALEVGYQFDWIYPGADADAFFEGEVERMLRGLGVTGRQDVGRTTE